MTGSTVRNCWHHDLAGHRRAHCQFFGTDIVDPDVRGRIDEYQVRPFRAHLLGKVVCHLRIAAQQLVAPQKPDIAELRDRLVIDGRHRVVGLISPFGISIDGHVEHEVNFGEAEPCQLHVELEIDQCLELDRHDVDLEPERFVFLDETWTATNMTRSQGRRRKGEHLCMGY